MINLNTRRLLVSLTATLNICIVAGCPSFADESAQERSTKELAERTEQLKQAESKKKENPLGYIYALTTMANVVRGNDTINKKPESPTADKYYDTALNYFLATKFDKAENGRIASHFWQTSNVVSVKEFRSAFDRLCRAIDRGVDAYGAVDSDMRQALKRRTHISENEIPVKEQMDLTQRAIDLRSAALGPRSRTLGPLFHSLGQYYEENKDLEKAEQYYLKVGELDSDPTEKASTWSNMALHYAYHQNVPKAIAAWRKHAAILNQNHQTYYVESEINLSKEFRKQGHPEYADEVTNNLLSNGDSHVFEKFDQYLMDAVDQYIKDTDFKKAQTIIQKRLAAGVRTETSAGLTDWKIRLSNVYLAEGKTQESEALFKQVIGSLALQGIQTDDLRRERAGLLERMGNKSESQAITKSMPKLSTAIFMKSPLMASDAIIFGHNSDVTFCNSSDPATMLPGHRFPSPPRFNTTPPDDESILSQGQIRKEGNFSYSGKMFCRESGGESLRRANKIEPVPAGFIINDALAPPKGTPDWSPQKTPGWPNQPSSGSFTATDLNGLGPIKPTALRIFLVDSPGVKEFDFQSSSQPVSFKQLQVWYNGIKKIILNNNPSGLVYAPHAVVELSFNSTFTGSIVARRIVFAGNNRITLDKAIVNQNFSK